MTRRGRLRDELRRLGNSPVPVLDAARAQRLERRVLGAARPRELELVDAGSDDPPRSSRRRVAVITLAAACVFGVIVIASLDPAGSSDRILSMTGDVDVVFPDGSVVDGTAGMTVPDGAILRLGRDGEAEVDGMTISGAGDYLVTPNGLTLLTTSNLPPSTNPRANGADEQATVAGEVPVVPSRPHSTEPGSATTVLRPTTTDRDSATTTVVRPTTTGRDTATTAVQPTTAQRVAPPPPVGSVEPRPTAPPSPTTSSAPATVRPPPRSEPTSTGPAPLDVTVRSDGRRVVFAWRPIAGAIGYVVAAVPAVGDGESSWPPAPGVELTDLPAGTLQHSVERPADGAWSYRIAAVARDGRTLALSRVFTIAS
jgi:hypothetical protein